MLSQRHFVVLKKEERVNGRKFNKALFKSNDKKKDRKSYSNENEFCEESGA